MPSQRTVVTKTGRKLLIVAPPHAIRNAQIQGNGSYIMNGNVNFLRKNPAPPRTIVYPRPPQHQPFARMSNFQTFPRQDQHLRRPLAPQPRQVQPSQPIKPKLPQIDQAAQYNGEIEHVCLNF